MTGSTLYPPPQKSTKSLASAHVDQSTRSASAANGRLPATSDPKLPNIRRDRPKNSKQPNAWLATDQAEKRKVVALVLVLSAAFFAGIWLIAAGLFR